MIRFLLSVFSVVFFVACSTDVVNDAADPNDHPSLEISENENDAEPVDKVYLFESDDEGVKEFMQCTKKIDGASEWVYFTAKNEKEVKLGSREAAGFEVVYFLAKPKELYWIYGSECVFTLSDEVKKTSQWYRQVKPRCADDMFE